MVFKQIYNDRTEYFICMVLNHSSYYDLIQSLIKRIMFYILI